ncbi:MAG: helix-turn-helix transcriptional regulator [Acidimicrobiia bacterium]|nr:helix-turn-helix transcriptional regulator [Acidimicrobiia bacterium]
MSELRDLDVALGRQVRDRRTRAGLSLKELAAKAELSPSFLSQLERGLARPRITSLHRVARTLGTTAQALLSTEETKPYSLVRRNDPRDVDHDIDKAAGTARSLVRDARSLTALEFRGVPKSFGRYYEHPGEELLLVVQGVIEKDIDGEVIELRAGDCICYDGRVPHRSRRVGEEEAIAYLITARDDNRGS